MSAMPANLTALLFAVQRQALPVHQTASVRAMLHFLTGIWHLTQFRHMQHTYIRLPCKLLLYLAIAHAM